MPAPDPAALAFLLARRSWPARLLAAPVPDRDTLSTILAAAARVPDHGKLAPWRFVVLERPALIRLGRLAAERGAALGIEPERAAKGAAQFADSPLAVVVVMVPRPTDKVPAVEQTLSTGAACLSLCNAALASGFAANWLTGWPVEDAEFRSRGLGLAPDERVAGTIHIGTPSATPPDRPRPDPGRIVTWVAA